MLFFSCSCHELFICRVKKGDVGSSCYRIYELFICNVQKGVGSSWVRRILFICKVQKGVCGGGNENPKRQKIGKRWTDKLSTKTRILVD